MAWIVFSDRPRSLPLAPVPRSLLGRVVDAYVYDDWASREMASTANAHWQVVKTMQVGVRKNFVVPVISL